MTECSSRRLAYFSCAIEDHFKKFFAKLNKLVINVSFVSNFFCVFRSNDDICVEKYV